MKIDRLARGPLPRDRVRPPIPGQRCPRCHQRVAKGSGRPCLLCNPGAVPAWFGGDAVTSRRDAAIIAARLPGRPR